MKLNQSENLHKFIKSYSTHPLVGGNAPLYLAYYQTYKFQPYESINQKSVILGRLSPYAVIKALKMLRQSTLILKPRILDCHDSALSNLTMTNLCSPRRHSERSEESILVIRESHSIRLHCTKLIALIRSWVIYFTHCFKSRDLDTSLYCVPLSMTKRFGLLRKFYEFSRNDEPKRVVILSLCKRRSIHFGDL